jgi:hypothetical protein
MMPEIKTSCFPITLEMMSVTLTVLICSILNSYHKPG